MRKTRYLFKWINSNRVFCGTIKARNAGFRFGPGWVWEIV